jgi:hypothetical protein
LDKFTDNCRNWTEHIKPVQEDIPKVVVLYNLQTNETQRGEVRFEREQDFVEGPME